eukprot:4305407-Alexandrium_andersonii.AAC.1
MGFSALRTHRFSINACGFAARSCPQPVSMSHTWTACCYLAGTAAPVVRRSLRSASLARYRSATALSVGTFTAGISSRPATV